MPMLSLPLTPLSATPSTGSKVLTLLPPELFARDKGGRIMTDACLRVRRGEGDQQPLPHVFSLGDCANVDGVNHPPTAQVAERQGLHLAHRWVCMRFHLGLSNATEEQQVYSAMQGQA